MDRKHRYQYLQEQWKLKKAAGLHSSLPSAVCTCAVDYPKGTNLSDTQERGKGLCDCQIRNFSDPDSYCEQFLLLVAEILTVIPDLPAAEIPASGENGLWFKVS